MSLALRLLPLALAGLAAACGGSGSREVPLVETPTSPGTVTLTAPVAQSPANDAQLDTLRPVLTISNATASASGARTYEFQLSDRSDFSTLLVTQASVAEGAAGTTSYALSSDLQPATLVYWRARATQSGTTSAWSTTAQFRTKLVGFNRPGQLYDPLVHGETIGTRSGATTFMGTDGLRVDNHQSWVRYQLAQTLTSGVISVEVKGLQANLPQEKARIFSMSDATPILFNSKFLFNVQYRGIPGNPDNAISYKVLMGDSDLKYEPDFQQRTAGVRPLNPNTTYYWEATWGSSFQLTVREGGQTGPIIYQRSQSTPGTYNPAEHFVYLGATDAGLETGSYPGAIYRNFWVGSTPRPQALGSALTGR